MGVFGHPRWRSSGGWRYLVKRVLWRLVLALPGERLSWVWGQAAVAGAIWTLRWVGASRTILLYEPGGRTDGSGVNERTHLFWLVSGE